MMLALTHVNVKVAHNNVERTFEEREDITTDG